MSNNTSSIVPLVLSGPVCNNCTSILSIPGSPLLFRPSLSLSSQTRLPILKKRMNPKSTLRFVSSSVSSSLVGSLSLVKAKDSDMTIVPICVPSSSLLVLVSVLAPGSKVAAAVPSAPVPVELVISVGMPLFIFT